MSGNGFDLRPAPAAPFNNLPLLGSGSFAGGGPPAVGLLDLTRFRSLLIAAQYNDAFPNQTPEYAWLQLQWWAAAQYAPFVTPARPANWQQFLTVRDTGIPLAPAPWDGQLMKVPVQGNALNITGIPDAFAGGPVLGWQVYGSAEQIDAVQYLDPQRPHPWSLQSKDVIPNTGGVRSFTTEGYPNGRGNRPAQLMLSFLQNSGGGAAITSADVQLWSYGPNGPYGNAMFYHQAFGASPVPSGLGAVTAIGSGQLYLPEGPYWAVVTYTTPAGAAYTGQLIIT